MNYEIIDKFLDEDQFVRTDIYFTTPQSTAWFLNEKLGTINFSHLLYSNSKPNSEKIELCSPLMEKLKVKALLRAEAFMYFKTHKIEKIQPTNRYEFEHKKAIFFINTNNGYIVLNDKDKIEAVENRIVIFDSNSLTSMTNCTDKVYRATIEFDYF
jgi:hypothetical protein